MTALDQARTAYGAMSAAIRTPRATEYDVFARVTRRLRAASHGDRQAFPELAAAVHDNRALWTLLASDVASPGNALPAELRAKLFYLAEFVEAHSTRVLLRSASAEALIEINTLIMRGLRPAESIT